jgi:transcriptional regulator with XRE-family HTH domain
MSRGQSESLSRPDSAMKMAQQLFQHSGKSLEELGREMGYEAGTARRAAWQFLHKTSDPRLSMLRRFARAMGVDVKDLL